jgi:hypothetical protein
VPPLVSRLQGGLTSKEIVVAEVITVATVATVATVTAVHVTQPPFPVTESPTCK